MGIYDRDYYQYREQSRPGLSLRLPQTIVGAIIAVNVAVWVANYFTPGQCWLSDHMAVHVDTLTKPWLWWQFLTAGFAHSTTDFQHILFNMLGLFFLGRDVEITYGRKEFLRVYLVMVVFASVVWCVANYLVGTSPLANARGASGAIAGVVVLYALNFPNRMLLVFFVIPMPAWLVGVIFVGLDILGATRQVGEPNIAYSMHLAGAAFALVYFKFGWNITQWTSGRFTLPKLRRGPRLRVHVPPEEKEKGVSNLTEEVDHILEKIYREGEASLTAKERKTLEMASREYQRKTHVGRDGGKRP